jgi:endonuclease/exonuclease/phosphatase family metal-dependent hydrolase
MQEVANEDDKPSVAEQVAEQLGYVATFSPAARGIYDQGLAIVSRYPISDIEIRKLKYCDLRFSCRTRFAQSADVQTPWGEVRVWNVHLDTRVNAGERLEQLWPVIEDASQRSGPRVIGGDFNTNDLRWIGNVIPFPGGRNHGATIRRAMQAKGFTTPFTDGTATFRSMNRQLDWIFIQGMDPVKWSVEPASFSDHHALWTEVHLPSACAEAIAC